MTIRRITALLLASLMLLPALVSCGRQGTNENDAVQPGEETVQTAKTVAPVYAKNNDWECGTASVTAGLSVEDGAVFINSLTFDGENRILRTPITLPDSYREIDAKDDSEKEFNWTFERALSLPGELSMIFWDDTAGCSYTVTCKARTDIAGPVEFSAKLVNTKPHSIRVIPGELFVMNFAFDETPEAFAVKKEGGYAEGMDIVHAHEGFTNYTEGTGIYHMEIPTDGQIAIDTDTRYNWNEDGYIPMVYLDGGDIGSYVAVEWTSDTIYVSATEGGVRVSVDYQNSVVTKQFSTVVPSGGDFIVPPIYVGTYNGDLDDGSNEFKRWFWLEKTPKTMLADPQEPYAQTGWFNDSVGTLPEIGVQSVKWDYGWWKGETGNPTGSWKLRAADWDMKEIGSLYHSNNLSWAVYVLLHNSATNPSDPDDQLTSVGRGHPEWFCSPKSPYADLGNENCVAYLKRKLLAFFTENHIDTWRTDYEPIAHESSRQNRHDALGTDVMYWNTRGFFEIVDFLLETIPGFRYEACSAGGAMKDFATAHRASNINCDDFANYWSLRTTFYDGTYMIHPAQLQMPCAILESGDPNHPNYAGHGDLDFAARSVIYAPIMGDLCYYERGAEYITLHNEKIKPLIREANFYHTLPRPDGIHWDAVQYGYDILPENGIGGALFIFKPSTEDGNEKHVSIRGLNPDFTYRADFYERKDQSFTATGRELLENGITVTINEDIGSEIVFFEVVNN